jgi:hypothetical protein
VELEGTELNKTLATLPLFIYVPNSEFGLMCAQNLTGYVPLLFAMVAFSDTLEQSNELLISICEFYWNLM